MTRHAERDRAGFGVFTYAYAAVTVLGLGVALGAGYLLMRGPFFGGGLLEPIPLILALCGFVAGIVAFAWGATRAAGIGSRY